MYVYAGIPIFKLFPLAVYPVGVTTSLVQIPVIVCSMTINQICTKLKANQSSRKLSYTFAFYNHFCKVCEKNNLSPPQPPKRRKKNKF